MARSLAIRVLTPSPSAGTSSACRRTTSSTRAGCRNPRGDRAPGWCPAGLRRARQPPLGLRPSRGRSDPAARLAREPGRPVAGDPQARPHARGRGTRCRDHGRPGYDRDVTLDSRLLEVRLPLRPDPDDTDGPPNPGRTPGTRAGQRGSSATRPRSDTEIQVLRGWARYFVGLPGEIFVEYQLELREKIASPFVFARGSPATTSGTSPRPRHSRRAGTARRPPSSPRGGGILLPRCSTRCGPWRPAPETRQDTTMPAAIEGRAASCQVRFRRGLHLLPGLPPHAVHGGLARLRLERVGHHRRAAGRGSRATASRWLPEWGPFDESDPAWSARETDGRRRPRHRRVDLRLVLVQRRRDLERGAGPRLPARPQPRAHEVRRHVGQPHLAEQSPCLAHRGPAEPAAHPPQPRGPRPRRGLSGASATSASRTTGASTASPGAPSSCSALCWTTWAARPASGKAVERMRRRAQSNGEPDLHLGVFTWSPAEAKLARTLGFDHATTYNIVTGRRNQQPRQAARGLRRRDARSRRPVACSSSDAGVPVLARRHAGLGRLRPHHPYEPWPPVALEWPWGHIVTGNTPERFGRARAGRAGGSCRSRSQSPGSWSSTRGTSGPRGRSCCPPRTRGKACSRR